MSNILVETVTSSGFLGLVKKVLNAYDIVAKMPFGEALRKGLPTGLATIIKHEWTKEQVTDLVLQSLLTPEEANKGIDLSSPKNKRIVEAVSQKFNELTAYNSSIKRVSTLVAALIDASVKEAIDGNVAIMLMNTPSKSSPGMFTKDNIGDISSTLGFDFSGQPLTKTAFPFFARAKAASGTGASKISTARTIMKLCHEILNTIENNIISTLDRQMTISGDVSESAAEIGEEEILGALQSLNHEMGDD